eukprot:5440739-Amphidinium_carterae.1
MQRIHLLVWRQTESNDGKEVVRQGSSAVLVCTAWQVFGPEWNRIFSVLLAELFPLSLGSHFGIGTRRLCREPKYSKTHSNAWLRFKVEIFKKP